jgi:hypothetical protein
MASKILWTACPLRFIDLKKFYKEIIQEFGLSN